MIYNRTGFRTTKSGTELLYSGHVRGERQDSAIVFISPSILPVLKTTLALHMDATFKVVPRCPGGLRQLMMLAVRAYDHVSDLI